MDEQQETRKKISLEKGTDKDAVHSPVREAYPVYNEEPDMEMLQKSEYRNTPQFKPYIDEQQYEDQDYELPPVAPQTSFPPAFNQQNQNMPQNQNMAQYRNGPQYYNNAQFFPGAQNGARRLPTPVPQNQQYPPAPQPRNNMKAYTQMKFCKYCGKQILSEAVVCTHCGRQVDVLKKTQAVSKNTAANRKVNISPKRKKTAMNLALLGFLGLGGFHRFYSGKVLSGMLYFCTAGLLGVGTIIDLIKINNDKFTDSDGNIIKK